MKLLHRTLALLLASSLAFAQAEPSPSAGGLRSDAIPETPAAVPDAMPPPPVALQAPAAATVTNPQAPAPNYQTGTLTIPTISSGESSGGGGGVLAAVGGLLGVCAMAFGGKGSAFGSTSGNSENVRLVSEQADRLNDSFGYQYESSFDRKFSEEMGASIYANYPKGCESNFISRDGRLGPWGRTAMQEIRDRPKSYADNEPPDVMKMCPKYKSFDKKKREEFWVWMFLSLASPESSCKPTAANRNAPNGTAKGLFQLENSLCNRVGVSGNIYEPHTNTRCAVRALAEELDRRDNLTSPTSRGSDSRRTYWGPLRNDINNQTKLRAKGGKGDAKGHLQFVALLKKFKGCQ